MAGVQKRRAEEESGGRFGPKRLRLSIVVLLLLTAFLSVIFFGAVDPLATSALGAAAAVIVILWLAESWRAGQFTIYLDALYLPLLGLVTIGFIQLLPLRADTAAQELLGVPVESSLSLDPFATRMFTVRLVILLVLFAAAFTFVDSKRKIRNFALWIIGFGAVMSFFAILQRLSGTDAIYGIRRTPQAIPFGPFVNQHHFAAFMELTSGLALGLLFGRSGSRERRIFLVFAAVLMGIAVIFTGSRGGLLSYLGVVAVAGVLSVLRAKGGAGNRRVGRMAALAGGAALFAGVTTAAFLLGGGEALFRGIGQNQADITSGRTHFWSVAWRIFTDYPILGAGFDAFGVAFTRYDTWNGTFRVEQAHNDYLQALADAGILGFACVAAFIYLFARKSLNVIARSADETRAAIAVGAAAGCTGILIHSIFDFPLRTTSNAIFFLLSVVIACAQVERGRSQNAALSAL